MMLRSVRWQVLNRRQRRIALGAFLGSSTLLTLGAWRNHRPILADSGSFSGRWHTKAEVHVAEKDHAPHGSPKTTDQGYPAVEATDTSHSNSTLFEADGSEPASGLNAWQSAISRVRAVCTSAINLKLPDGASLTGWLLPAWAISLPEWIEKLNNELSMAPWSLSWEIWEDAHDPEINPEIVWDAQVRISKDLCKEEQAFLQSRKHQTARALAKYIGVPEKDVHPDDVPVIAMCGSGGGLRALVAGASSFLSAQKEGLFDCVTYTAGVSGSCWLQSLYYSSIGQQDYGRIIEHLKQRLDVHIAHPAPLLAMLGQSPTNKYLLSGLVEKLKGVPDADFGLVDIYGLALAARLLVPRGELSISDRDLKVSCQRTFIDDGSAPMPIYTAVSHEIPESVENVEKSSMSSRFTAQHYDWFQWFEWTPYEFACEELDAAIPTWAVGRRWDAGNTAWRENDLALPELRIPMYLGIWGSAFCATLSHYYKEIRPLVKASGLGTLDKMLAGKDEELLKVHPIDAAVIPSFFLGLRHRLSSSSPPGIHTSSHLALMDAGMANNLPIYPLLRPNRNVDIIIAFDASADVRGDNWIKVVDGYARQRDIKGWPMGAGWPPSTDSSEEIIEDMKEREDAARSDEPKAAETRNSSENTLGYCTVWAGTKEERDVTDDFVSQPIKSEADHDMLMEPKAGIAVVYFPFLANSKVPGVDPLKEDFMSTWNFVYTPENIDKVVALAQANYEEGRDQTRRVVRAVWERKKRERLQRERAAKDLAKRARLARESAAMRRNADHGQGDQFS